MSRRPDLEARRFPRQFPTAHAAPSPPQSILRAQENERKHISRELHDEMGQALMTLRFSLGMLVKDAAGGPLSQRAQEGLDILDKTIDGLRRIIGRLSPRPLEDLGLLGAIRREADLLTRQTGMRASISLPRELDSIDHEVEVALYRSVQEALHNIFKHSHGRKFTVALESSLSRLSLQIADDGH